MPTRIEQLEHDGNEIIGGLAPLVEHTEIDPNIGLTPEQIKLKNLRENPSESRREMMARRNRPANEPWLHVNNPLIWTGDEDDD